MRKLGQRDFKILARIKQKAVKGGNDKGQSGLGCPPPEPTRDDEASRKLD